MAIYQHTALYRAFFAPSEEMRASIDSLVRVHKPGGRTKARRVIDPACGAGLWLDHFLDRGATVAGVELDADVAVATAARLGGRQATVVAGDMRSPPEKAGADFDLAINLDNSVGHLGGGADLATHLAAMHRLMAKDGVYLLGLAIREPGDRVDPGTIYERGPLPIEPAGFAALRSETLGLHDPGLPDGLLCERIRHYILTAGVEGLGPFLVERYDLLTFPIRTLLAVLEQAGPWTVLDCRDATDESLPRTTLKAGCGDVLLVLRPARRMRAATKPVGKLVGRKRRRS